MANLIDLSPDDQIGGESSSSKNGLATSSVSTAAAAPMSALQQHGDETLLGRIRSNTRSSTSSSSHAIHRTSTRDSHQSAGSSEHSQHQHGLSGIISSTKSLFKRHHRDSVSSSTTPSPTDPTSNVTTPRDSSSSPVISPKSDSGSESRRPPPSQANNNLSSSTTTPHPTNIGLPPPLLPDQTFGNTSTSSSATATAPAASGVVAPVRRIGSPVLTARTSSDNTTASISSTFSNSVSGASTSATTASDSSPLEHPSSSQPSAALQPAGAPSMLPLSASARYKALPRLASYTVTHPDAIAEHGGEVDYDTTTTMSGTETEHDTEHDETEQEEEEEESEADDDEEDEEDEREHDERDVRGGMTAMRTSMHRPALPTLSSTRGFSRSANTPGVSPTTTTTNPFNFAGWTTFASSTPTPGPLRTARPQSGDNAMNGSYFDPRPTSSSSSASRNSATFHTPAQTPRGEGASGSSKASTTTSISPAAGKARQQHQQVATIVPTPGSSISPPSSRIRVEGTRPTSGSPLARRQSPGTFVRSAAGTAIPSSAIPSIPGGGSSSSPYSSTSSTNPRASLATQQTGSTSGRPSFYHRQSKSLVDLSRSLDSDTSGPSFSQMIFKANAPESSSASAASRQVLSTSGE
jgi:hypothetical protein